MPGGDDHYQTLGISRDADAAAIRSAFRRLARQHHPDVAKGEDGKRFLAIQEAYEALRDPARKAAYDATLRLTDEVSREADREARRREREKEEERRLEEEARRRWEDAPPPPREDEAVVRLEGFLSRGQYAEAERLAREIIEREPRLAKAHAALGDVMSVRGNRKQAAKFYAYAAQLDPRVPEYERRHAEMIRRTPVSTAARTDTQPDASPFAIWLGLFVAAMFAVFVATSPGATVGLGISLIQSWTPTIVMALLGSGLAVGAAFAKGGVLGPFDEASGSAVARVSPITAMTALSLVNLWIACVAYFAIGSWQDSFNASVSRALALAACVAGLIALAAALSGSANPVEVLVWGGNLAFPSLVLGWYVSDALSRVR